MAHPVADPYQSQTRTAYKWLTGVAILVLLSLLLSSSMAGWTRQVVGKDAPAMTSKLGEDGAAFTQKPGQETPAFTEVPHEVDPSMPNDVRLWLEHLHRIEQRRMSMATSQISSLVVKMTMIQGAGATQGLLDGLLGGEEQPEEPQNTPATEVQDDTEKMRAEWKALADDFHSLPPPPICVPLRNSFDQVLGQTESMIIEVLGSLNRASEDPQAALAALMNMRGTSASRIDLAAQNADKELGAICGQYKTRPWFRINADTSGSMLSGFGGLPGLGNIPGLGGGQMPEIPENLAQP